MTACDSESGSNSNSNDSGSGSDSDSNTWSNNNGSSSGSGPVIQKQQFSTLVTDNRPNKAVVVGHLQGIDRYVGD